MLFFRLLYNYKLQEFQSVCDDFTSVWKLKCIGVFNLHFLGVLIMHGKYFSIYHYLSQLTSAWSVTWFIDILSLQAKQNILDISCHIPVIPGKLCDLYWSAFDCHTRLNVIVQLIVFHYRALMVSIITLNNFILIILLAWWSYMITLWQKSLWLWCRYVIYIKYVSW